MNGSIAEWRELGARPVSSEAPAGVSIRYDPDFEALEGEIQKQEGLSGQPVDWAQVVLLGRKILEQKSKDILVGSYVTVGLLHIEGFTGLAEGLACLEAMIAGHWPDLFPRLKRLRARINALNWLAEKAGSEIAQGSIEEGDGEAATACETQVKSFLALLQEKIPADSPDMTDLLRPLQEHIRRKAPEPAAAAPGPEKKSRQEPQSPPAVAATASSIETAEDARRFLKDSTGPFKRALSLARRGQPAVSAPYRLMRALTWGEIDTIPPAAEGRTRIPAPPAHLRDRCRSLAERSAWHELIDETESRVPEFPFWLDLHRMSDQALAGMGPDYSGACGAVRAEVISLLTRLPALPEMQFSDGTPFADDATHRWIATELFPAKEDAAAVATASPAPPDFLAELRDRGRDLMREGKQAEAIGLVQQAVRTTSTGRERFLVQLELAGLCLEAGQTRPALACIEILDEQIRQSALETWEPDLCVAALRLYWEALHQSAQASRQSAPEMMRQADAVYSRLCRLDVVAGLQLTKAMRR